LIALERLAETIAVALPEDALSALTACRFRDERRCINCSMEVLGPLIKLTFFLSTPGVAEATAGGFPAISAAPGQVLPNDLVLLAASLSLLFASVRGRWLDVQKS
jgi:reactive chlorine resistance protein C